LRDYRPSGKKVRIKKVAAETLPPNLIDEAGKRQMGGEGASNIEERYNYKKREKRVRARGERGRNEGQKENHQKKVSPPAFQREDEKTGKAIHRKKKKGPFLKSYEKNVIKKKDLYQRKKGNPIFVDERKRAIKSQRKTT